DRSARRHLYHHADWRRVVTTGLGIKPRGEEEERGHGVREERLPFRRACRPAASGPRIPDRAGISQSLLSGVREKREQGVSPRDVLAALVAVNEERGKVCPEAVVWWNCSRTESTRQSGLCS